MLCARGQEFSKECHKQAPVYPGCVLTAWEVRGAWAYCRPVTERCVTGLVMGYMNATEGSSWAKQVPILCFDSCWSWAWGLQGGELACLAHVQLKY